MEEGYIKLSRKFFANDMWKEARTFSECEAWLDLIQSARFEATPRKVSIGGREVSYTRSQYPASIRFLAKKWRWTERKVRSFLTKLKKEGMISTECQQGMSVITITNYDKYNGKRPESGNDTANDTDNILKIKCLVESLTQLVTQSFEKRHTGDTKLIKDNKKKISTDVDIKESPSSAPPVSLYSLEEIKAMLPRQQIWSEAMCREFGMNHEQLSVFISSYIQELKLSGITSKTLPDAMAHCRNLLRKRRQLEKTPGAAPAKSWRQQFTELAVEKFNTPDDINTDEKPFWQ